MLDTLLIALPNSWLAVLLTAIQAYLLGSISTAIIVVRVLHREDIRDKGSGNAGATNVLRNYGTRAAIITTLGDLAKSILAVFCGGLLLMHLQLTGADEISMESLRLVGRYLGGVCCVLGHLYPVFFRFHGGKGVMASLGLIIILDYRVALICLAVFLITLAIGRMVSLGSVAAVFFAPFLVYLFGTYVDHRSAETVAFCTAVITLIVTLVILKHASNISRICHGTEHKLSFKKKKD